MRSSFLIASAFVLCSLVSCGNPTEPEGNLQTDIVGYWTGRQDVLGGYMQKLWVYPDFGVWVRMGNPDAYFDWYGKLTLSGNSGSIAWDSIIEQPEHKRGYSSSRYLVNLQMPTKTKLLVTSQPGSVLSDEYSKQ